MKKKKKSTIDIEMGKVRPAMVYLLVVSDY